MNNFCRICFSKTESVNYAAKEMMFGFRDQFIYFQCSKCFCLQIHKYPDNLIKYYGDNYYSYGVTRGVLNIIKRKLSLKRDLYAAGKKDILGSLLFKLWPNAILKNTFESISPALQGSKNKKILDVGCGSGLFLKILDGLGFKNLFGIDLFIKQDILINNKIPIFKKNLCDYDGKYDVIFLHHSLEHMPNQSEVACKINSLLEKNGICLIRIPICSSYAWERYSVNWVQLDAPRHFYLHSIQSISILMEQANLEIYKTIYDSTGFQISASECYTNNITLCEYEYAIKRGEIFTAAELLSFETYARQLNIEARGDQAIFFVRKKIFN